MKVIPTTLFALTTLIANVPCQAQGQPAPQQRLERARLLEQREGDLAAAERAYRALLADASASNVHDDVAFQLGAMLWRLERHDEAQALLARAAASGEQLAAKVAAVRAEDGEAAAAAQERQDRGRALVERFVELRLAGADNREPLQVVRAEMDKLPGPCADALVEWLGQPRARTRPYAKDGVAAALVRTLWELGTDSAVRFLTSVAEGEDLEQQRLVASMAEPPHLGSNSFADDLQPVLRAFAKVQDPTREVWNSVVKALREQSAESIARAVADEHPAVHEAGLHAVRAPFQQHLSRTDAVDLILTTQGDRLVSFATGANPEMRMLAWSVLLHALHTREVSSLLLRAAEQAPDTVPGEPQQKFRQNPVDGKLLAQILATAEAIAAWPNAADTTHARALVASMLSTSGTEWDANGVAPCLRLLELGYGAHTANSYWVSQTYRLATAEQRATIVRTIPHMANPMELIGTVAREPVPQNLFPALRDVLEAVDTTSGDRNRRMAFAALLHATARSGHPDAGDWFSEQIDNWPDQAGAITYYLVRISRAGGHRSAARGLRVLMTDVPQTRRDERLQAFYELVRIGDLDAIKDYPRAVALGMPNGSNVWYAGNDVNNGDGIEAALRRVASDHYYSYLMVLGSRSAHNANRWHGYDDEAIVRVWRALLTGDAAPMVWQNLTQVTGNRPWLPTSTIPLFAELLPEHPEATSIHGGFHTCLAPALAGMTADDARNPTMRRALSTLLASTPAPFAAFCYRELPNDVARSFVDEALAKLRDSGSIEWLNALAMQGISLQAADWRSALQGPDTDAALAMLPPDAPEELRADVAAQLASRSAVTRQHTAIALARVFGRDAAQDLLPLLQDPQELVRTTAREQLTLLREAQEQRQFWNRVQGGVDLSPQATSQKLMQQAQPGNDAEQRVLAIRSLAAIAATEALPHLIEWSGDEGTEPTVRDAAQKAVSAILTAAEAGK